MEVCKPCRVEHGNKAVVRRPNAIVLKIYGVLASYKFEEETLPEFTKQHMSEYLQSSSSERFMVHLITRLRKDSKLDLDSGQADAPQVAENLEGQALNDAVEKYAKWKMLQGALHLKTHVFEDAARAVNEWRFGKFYMKNYTMDDGTKEGQKHYVQSTNHGDLATCFNNYVAVTDPEKKKSPKTYEIITSMIRDTPDNIMFVTDSPWEAKAAKGAGLLTLVVQRPGEPSFPKEELEGLTVVSNLDEIQFEEDPTRPVPCC
ncbi:Enolase-phosphatase E1 [Halotydeus destructor]|nr:Enolase-phosphatase E1 [Halotydeus destructor]